MLDLATRKLKRRYWSLLGRLNRPRFPEIFGDDFAARWRWLRTTGRWSARQMADYQAAALRDLVAVAWERTDFYRDLFESAALRPEDIRTPADLVRLPVIDKEHLRRRGAGMVNRALAADALEHVTTGGSTGVPTDLWRRPGPDMRGDWAFLYRQWREAGWRHGDRVLRIRGLSPRPGENGLTMLRRADEHSLTLSSYELSAENYPAILRTIAAFGPRFLDLYPSVLGWLGGMIRARGDRVAPVRAIFCESEVVTGLHRELAEAVWGAKVFAGYGNSERSVDAVECRAHAGYHVNGEYGIVELLDERGEVITRPGVEGDIVTTGLLTTTMPMIRYNTGDRAAWLDGPCPCGRPGPRLGQIAGRRGDCLVSADGRAISMAALNHFRAMGGILQYRFYQSEIGRARLDYLAADGVEIDLDGLRAEVREKTGGGLDVAFRRVDGFALSPRGKHRLVEQALDVEACLGATAEVRA